MTREEHERALDIYWTGMVCGNGIESDPYDEYDKGYRHSWER